MARFYADNVFSTGNDFAATPSFDSSYVTFIITVTESGIGGPTVSVSADGTTLINNFAIDFEGLGRYISFGTHLGTDTTDTAGLEFADTSIDNLSITIVPEPSAFALISGLMMVSWVALKRCS